MKIVISNNLKGKKLSDLLLFVEKYCDKFSMEGIDSYTGALNKDEFDLMYKEMSKHHYFEGLEEMDYNTIINSPQRYDINHPDLLQRTISIEGIDSFGLGLYCNCYFILSGEVYNKTIRTMKSLFRSSINYAGEIFINIIFYSGNIQMLIIYRELAFLNLNKEQYQEFLKLDIEHEEYKEGYYYVTDAPVEPAEKKSSKNF